MAEKPTESDASKAKVFFERGRKVAETGNFDYAIDMYLEGIRCEPDALSEGHVPLRELAMQRQSQGGKKPSMMEKMKRMRGKTALEQLVNAEYLFAKDPEGMSHAESMLKAATAGGFKRTALWIADLLFQSNNASDKPSFSTYVLLKDCYKKIGQYDRALAACQRALKLRPQEGDLADELKNLSAEVTVSRGKYDMEGDFRKSIKDRESQEKLQSQQSVVKTVDFREKALKEAREVYEEEPDVPQHIHGLADALAGMQSEEADAEAIKLLEETSEKKKDFSYKERAGKIKIGGLKRKIKKVKSLLKKNPDDPEAKKKLESLSKELNEVELEHYRCCVENYPTDPGMKYEYGVRLLRHESYDDAIPFLQESQRDPRHRISALNRIGYCFFKKGWFSDAIDVFKQAIETYPGKDDGTAKELRYNLARSYEEQGELEQALEVYRRLAQLDFGFSDVRERVDKLRSGKSK